MPSRLLKFLAVFGAIAFVLMFSLLWLKSEEPSRIKVSFLDVGQGDSILIQTPQNQNILIDGGPDDMVIHGLSKNLSWWDRTIDLLILTHPHDDHVTGLNDVLKRYQVKKIAYTGVIHNSPNYIAWLKSVQAKKIPMFIINQPRKIILNEDCVLDVIYPTNGLLNKEIDNVNNSSIVVKLNYKDVKFLFTGDVEEIVEEKLLADSADLKSHVLKIAHHGSDTSSIDDFLKKVDPDVAVISVGKDNKFGHPNGRTLNKLERLGVKIFRTDQDREINLVSDGVKIFKE